MKALPCVACIVTAFAGNPAGAVEFWHSSTLWAGQGQCSAVFLFDSEDEPITNLRVAVTVLNKAGKKIANDTLEIESFGDSTATRYAYANLEGEEVCEDDLTIVVNSATASVGGKRTDLLKAKSLTARDFKPFKIRIGK